MGPTKETHTSTPVPSDCFTFQILNETIRFDGNLDYYLEIRSHFKEMGVSSAETFCSNFYSTYKDMDNFVHTFPNDFRRIFKSAIDSMNEILSENNIFGITQDELNSYAQKYCYHTMLEFGNINDQYQKIVDKQEGMKRYRDARKESRGRVVGGGFGFQGAVKGMATAGAINMTTGALHSVGNALGNMSSAISALNEKDKLFKSGIVSYLSYAIEADILSVHLIATDIIYSRLDIRLCKFTDENKQQSDKIFDDLDNSLIPYHNRKMAVIQMLTTYPFEPRYYQMAVSLFPNELDNLRNYADFFGFDIDVIYNNWIMHVDSAMEVLLEYQDEVKDLSANLRDLMEHFAKRFAESNEKGFSFLPDETEVCRKKLLCARSSYAAYQNEFPLVLYDASFGHSGKDGFLITNKSVYIKTTRGGICLSLNDALNDINQEICSNGCTYLYFGEHHVHLLNAGDMIHEDELEDYMEQIIASILFVTAVKPQSCSLLNAMIQYQRLPHPKVCTSSTKKLDKTNDSIEVCYCFECGAENVAGDKFCFECGAELF